jgi:hypothetical protein
MGASSACCMAGAESHAPAAPIPAFPQWGKKQEVALLPVV